MSGLYARAQRTVKRIFGAALSEVPEMLLSDLFLKEETEPVQPISDRLMAHIDALSKQQVIDIAKGQREANNHHHRRADDI